MNESGMSGLSICRNGSATQFAITGSKHPCFFGAWAFRASPLLSPAVTRHRNAGSRSHCNMNSVRSMRPKNAGNIAPTGLEPATRKSGTPSPPRPAGPPRRQHE